MALDGLRKKLRWFRVGMLGTYLAGVVTHAHYSYDGLDPDVKSLARVSIKFFLTGSGRYSEFEFRDVPLGQVAQATFTPTPLDPATSVVEEQGWRFSLVRCSPIAVEKDHDGQGVQCFFKLENLKADRGVDLHGPSFVDPEGRTFDSSWYYGPYTVGYLGNAVTYAHTAAVPYLNPNPVYGLNQKLPRPTSNLASRSIFGPSLPVFPRTSSTSCSWTMAYPGEQIPGFRAPFTIST